MRPSIISERRFDGSPRHTWRRPLPPIDQDVTKSIVRAGSEQPAAARTLEPLSPTRLAN